MIKYLVDHGADVNGKNKRIDTYTEDSEAGKEETPLHLAVKYEFLDMVKYLVEHGARVNERSRFGVTPLLNVTMPNFYDNSVKPERLSIIKYLIDEGADVNCYSERYGTPLSNISKSGSIDAIKYVLEHGANPNLGEYSPLISQIWRQYSKPEIVKLLLDYGASVNEADEKERTILMMASYKGYKDIVRMLVNIDSSFLNNTSYL
jgi:ankyrin repeat protein